MQVSISVDERSALSEHMQFGVCRLKETVGFEWGWNWMGLYGRTRDGGRKQADECRSNLNIAFMLRGLLWDVCGKVCELSRSTEDERALFFIPCIPNGKNSEFYETFSENRMSHQKAVSTYAIPDQTTHTLGLRRCWYLKTVGLLRGKNMRTKKRKKKKMNSDILTILGFNFWVR